MHALDGLEEDLGRFLLQHQAYSTTENGLLADLGSIYARQHEDTGATRSSAEAGEAVEAVLLTEHQVEQDHVRLLADRSSHRVSTIADLPHDGNTRLTVEQHTEPGAHNGVILNDEHTNHLTSNGRH